MFFHFFQNNKKDKEIDWRIGSGARAISSPGPISDDEREFARHVVNRRARAKNKKLSIKKVSNE